LECGDGNDISFYYDNWIENRCLLDLLKLEYQENFNPGMKVCEFIQDKQWNVHKLSQHISNQDIIHKIIGIPILVTEIKESFCWRLSNTGSFTTKSATWLAHEHMKGRQPWPFKWIWRIDTMSKVKIFL